MIMIDRIVIGLWVMIGIITFIKIQTDRNSMKKDDKCAYNYLAYQFYLIYFMLMIELIINMVIKF